MTEVRRYSLLGEYEPIMVQQDDGEYVLAADFDALRQALAQQAQEVDIVSADLSEARHQIGLLQQRIDTHCMTEAELRQQVATMETNAADNGALFRAVLNEKLTLAQEVERLKEKYETATKFIASLGQERDDAVAQRAAMTAERDAFKTLAESNARSIEDKGKLLAASQARVRVLEERLKPGTGGPFP